MGEIKNWSDPKINELNPKLNLPASEITLLKKVLAVALAVAAALALNGAALQAEEMLNGAGATFPYPVYSAWANEYNKITGVKLNYQSIGSGRGYQADHGAHG